MHLCWSPCFVCIVFWGFICANLIPIFIQECALLSCFAFRWLIYKLVGGSRYLSGTFNLMPHSFSVSCKEVLSYMPLLRWSELSVLFVHTGWHVSTQFQFLCCNCLTWYIFPCVYGVINYLWTGNQLHTQAHQIIFLLLWKIELPYCWLQCFFLLLFNPNSASCI